MTNLTIDSNDARMVRLTLRIAGAALVIAGLLGLGLGSIWAPMALELLSDDAIGIIYGTLVPFVPVFLIAFGAFLLTKSIQ